MSFMTLAMLFSKQKATMPMGGSGSKAGAVGVCGVAGAADAIVEAEGGMHIGGSGSKLEAIGICGVASCTTSTAVPWVAAAAAVAPTREVLRNCASSAVMRPIHRRLSTAVNRGSARWRWANKMTMVRRETYRALPRARAFWAFEEISL